MASFTMHQPRLSQSLLHGNSGRAEQLYLTFTSDQPRLSQSLLHCHSGRAERLYLIFTSDQPRLCQSLLHGNGGRATVNPLQLRACFLTRTGGAGGAIVRPVSRRRVWRNLRRRGGGVTVTVGGASGNKQTEAVCSL